MAGKKLKGGVEKFSWEDDGPGAPNNTAANSPTDNQAPAPKRSRKKAAAQDTAFEDQGAVAAPSAAAPAAPRRRTAAMRKEQVPTLETMFDAVGAKFPTILEPDGELGEVGMGLAKNIGFHNSFMSARDVVALAMYHSALGKGKRSPAEMNPKDVLGMLNLVSDQLHSPEFQFYQEAIKWPVYVDTAIIKVVNKGAMGFMFYGLRSTKATNEGLRPYDLVSKVEDLALGAGVVKTIYSMVRAHKLYQEEALETAGDIITNPAIQQQLLLTSYSMILPELADAAEAPSMGAYVNEHYLQHVKKFLNVEEGDTGFVASVLNSIEGYLVASADEAAEKAKKTLELLQNKEDGFTSDLARILKSNVNDISKFSAAAARASEILLFCNPMTTIHMGNAIAYDMTELTVQARLAGKHLDAGKLQSLYVGDGK